MIHENKIEKWIRFLVNAAKYTLAKREDAYMNGLRRKKRDIRLSRTQTSAVSEHVSKTRNYPLWDEVKFIDRDPHWYSRRVKEAILLRLHPNNINADSRIEIVQIVRLSKSTLSSDEDLQCDIKVTIVRQTIN